MKHWKRILIFTLYFIVVSIILYINSNLIVDWLNKSLFADYDISIDMDRVEESFFNGASFVFLFTILLYALIGTFLVSLIITNIIFSGLVFANQTKVTERNEFITFKELQTISSPKELLSFVEIPMDTALITVFSIILLLIILHYSSKFISNKLNFHIGIKSRVIIFIVAVIPFFFMFQKPNFYNEVVLQYEEVDGHNFNPVTRARKQGYLPSFFQTVNPNYLHMPETYSKDNIFDIFDTYTGMATSKNKSRTESLNESQTIYYLSETLMDPAAVPNLLENETPIPYISEMVDKHIGGTMYSQYIGGGTANIEWSLLTSFSLEAFNDPISVTPYSDFYVQSDNHHTVLDFFETNKTALHPYSAHLYKRRSVYDAIGFNDFLYLNNGIKHTDKLGTHKRVSDEAFHQDIIRVSNDDNVGFIHALTMQNHSPFSGEIPDMDYKPDINLDVYPEEQEKELFNFLQGLKASDVAVQDLIEELDTYEIDVNFVFFGDHFPSLFRGMHEQFPGDILHETPWFIYMNNNRSDDRVNIDGLSPMFFTTVLLREGDYFVSPFQGLLDELLDCGVKRIGKDFVVTDRGQLSDKELNEDLLDMIDDYRNIQYDALFGSNWLPEAFFLDPNM